MGLSAQREISKVKSLKPPKPKKGEVLNLGNLYNIDLSFPGVETRHSTHALHSYVAAINPPLAKVLIETYIPEHENILDPFCGGGGVLVESVLNKRPCAGAEVNPLGVIISKAKTTYISKKRILEFGEKIESEAKLNRKDLENLDLDEKILFWFKKKNLLDIISLSREVSKAKASSDIKVLFQAVLSATIRDVMLTYRGEIRLRKLRDKDYERFNADTFGIFHKRYILAAERVSELPKGAKADVEIRDIRKLPFKDKSFYGIICSPPYADDKNGVGYFQFSKNMLALLNFTNDQVKDYRSLFLGMVKEDKLPPNSKSLGISLKKIKKNKPEKYQEAVAFYSDYAEGLKEMVRVTRKRIIIVIGNRVLGRTEFDNAAITVDLFKDLGVELEHHYTRTLNKKRIANLGGDGGGINVEHILVFKK